MKPLISFQKLIGNLDKITIAKLDMPTPEIFELLFQKFLRRSSYMYLKL